MPSAIAPVSSGTLAIETICVSEMKELLTERRWLLVQGSGYAQMACSAVTWPEAAAGRGRFEGGQPTALGGWLIHTLTPLPGTDFTGLSKC